MEIEGCFFFFVHRPFLILTLALSNLTIKSAKPCPYYYHLYYIMCTSVKIIISKHTLNLASFFLEGFYFYSYLDGG